MSRIPGWILGGVQLVFVVGVILFALVLSNALKPDSSATPAPDRRQAQGPLVSLIDPEMIRFTPVLSLTGTVEAGTLTSVVPQVSGKVVRVSPSFRPGALISQGAVLFEIDPADFRLAVEQSEANIEMARSELAVLEAESAAAIRDWNELYPGQQISDLAASKPQIAAAMARLASAVAARKTAELNLSRTIVRAPARVRVLETQLDVGQVVAPSTVAGRLYALEGLEISTSITPDDLRRLGKAPGKPVTISSQLQNGSPVSGTVSRLGASLDQRTRLATLFITPDTPEAFIAGEFVSVEIEGAATENAWQLPATAFTSLDQLWVVESDRLSGRKVTVLGRENGNVITAVFDPADGIVALPPSNASDTLMVRITDSPPAALRPSGTSASEAADGRK